MQFEYLNTSYVIKKINKESYPLIKSTIFKFYSQFTTCTSTINHFFL